MLHIRGDPVQRPVVQHHHNTVRILRHSLQRLQGVVRLSDGIPSLVVFGVGKDWLGFDQLFGLAIEDFLQTAGAEAGSGAIRERV